ncbi:MAG: sulfatase modifying factor 1 [Saprospiraceae bacterium]|jgi:sulfatase modifying factor 1
MNRKIIYSLYPILLLLTLAACINDKPSRPAPVIQKESSVSTAHILIDTFEVSVGAFAMFVDATQYTTTADSFGWSGVWDLTNGEWTVGDKANWAYPDGANKVAENQPVVHVSYKDACDYCAWKGGRLPSAAEWDSYAGDSVIVGNVWQGLFPKVDQGLDGYKTITAPIGSFTPNARGLHDLFGNVWEWTTTMDENKGERIIKGGSFLCDYNVCQGYIPSRYQTTADDSGLNHLGFRCVYDL